MIARALIKQPIRMPSFSSLSHFPPFEFVVVIKILNHRLVIRLNESESIPIDYKGLNMLGYPADTNDVCDAHLDLSCKDAERDLDLLQENGQYLYQRAKQTI